ncbi:MAG: glycosyltransferase, partial [Nocardioides sp.]|uniref:CgeB family protein n=1 Tax=Nocardioides sp. TaxID=35761 RepID=UPI0039E59532
LRDAGDAVVPVPAPLGPLVMTRTDDLVAVRGVDPLLGETLTETDLGLRLADAGRGGTVLVPGARITTLKGQPERRVAYVGSVRMLEQRHSPRPDATATAYAGFGFDVVGYRHEEVQPQAVLADALKPSERRLWVPSPVVVPARSTTADGAPVLRWTIDLASPPGERGLKWGDVHFARSLAEALERRGQIVAVDNRNLRHRGSRDLDDVVLVIRGLDRVDPRPGQVTMQWIISHPDLVTRDEVAPFDHVFAASLSWARERTREWGVRIDPLLQATDPALFSPSRLDPAYAAPVLFVGNSRNHFRTSVRSALAVGAPVDIHGEQWDQFLGPDAVRSRRVENAELGRLYASAGVVLNDHWEDMRRDGFLSNRLFDAAASGARIVSDDVAGLREVFGDQVQVFRDDADMARLLDDPVAAFPSAEERRELAEQVRAEHSFDARAAELLDAAVRLTGS